MTRYNNDLFKEISIFFSFLLSFMFNVYFIWFSVHLIFVFFWLQIGPGVVYLTFNSIFGRGVYTQSVTPVEPLVLKVIHNIYVNKNIPNILAKFFLLAESIQVRRYSFSINLWINLWKILWLF